MTCEDTRITWEIQLHEPCSNVWISKAYGRATTTAQPAQIAHAVLVGYLATSPPSALDEYRALARPDGGQAVFVTPRQLDTDTIPDAVTLRALPAHLRPAEVQGGRPGR
ncbi:hypothetical protein [Streptomyces sp. AD55]|uniref:hypothetical protein n=1 Tax=Streptomyces sp. AD55 TaxID=3242895 RepID=UPI003528D8B7